MVRQSWSIVQSLVVNYNLVVSYPRQWHIGINVSHWCAIITTIDITLMLLFAFSHPERWIIFKLFVIIVIRNEKQKYWPYKQYYVKTSRKSFFENFSENFFFQIQEKLKTCRNLNLTYFRRSCFWNNRNLTFTS